MGKPETRIKNGVVVVSRTVQQSASLPLQHSFKTITGSRAQLRVLRDLWVHVLRLKGYSVESEEELK